MTKETTPTLIEEKLAGGGLATAVIANKTYKLPETEKDLDELNDGYQLKFVGKNYAKFIAGQKTQTVIVPDIEHNAKDENKNSKNIFITGDNLDALKHLENAYTSKVDVIYIDPPYNTGGDDFVYHDNFKFTDEDLAVKLGLNEKEIERVRALDGKSSHSAWLTFMYPRLVIAKRLLKDTGVIFISIDDNEQANLKLLCDEVFGEGNFVAKFDWRKKTGANDAKDIAIITESILLYAKNHSVTIENALWMRDEYSIDKNRYKYSDDFFEIRGKYYFDTLDRGGLQYSDSMNFGIEAPDGGMIFPNGRSTFENDGWIWKWSKDKVKWGIENKFLEFVKSDKSQGSKYTIKYKVYQNVDNEGNIREVSGRAFLNLITEPINQQGNADFSNLFNGKIYFSNPKPVGLIQYLLKTIDTKSALILDFFAGSGTTADAVMQLNKEDGGSRNYILVQLDEKVKSNSEAEKQGYKTIDEISRERIKKAAEKIASTSCSELDLKSSNLFEIAGQDSNDVMDLGFKSFYLKTPNITTLEKIEKFVASEELFVDDMISPFSAENLQVNGGADGVSTLLTTWLLDDGYPFDGKLEKIEFGGQAVGYKNGSRLYILDKKWDTEATKDLLNRIGKNEMIISTIIVYAYSLGFEALRELKTNLKTNLDEDHKVELLKRF